MRADTEGGRHGGRGQRVQTGTDAIVAAGWRQRGAVVRRRLHHRHHRHHHVALPLRLHRHRRVNRHRRRHLDLFPLDIARRRW